MHFSNVPFASFILEFFLFYVSVQCWIFCAFSQDDLLDEDRLMLDRSPDEIGSHGNDLDELCASDSDLDDDANETTTDGERIIYPWMKKIHVAGVGKLFPLNLLSDFFVAKQINSRFLFRILCVVISKWFFLV